ncbi:glycosyltransferase family A protein [Dongia deserti]|uniref:glycosyltransferase family A protein n=1 Tax=Dongia deserti TaxID=2268030 RepID=UPI000E65B854|nr:glycosyltransferase family A protein [Dongia deserti]
MSDFAVVIPIYNKRPHIARALQSVFDQTEPPAEIFVVDDASTDGGLDEVVRYRDERLTILRRSEPGPGGYAARNMAILRAQSEWVAFLDADDAWAPNHLAAIRTTIARAEAPDRIGGIFSGYSNVWPDGREEPDRYTSRIGRDDARLLDFPALLATWLELKECPVWTSASAFRRQTLIDAGLFPAGRCSRGGDKDLWLRVARDAPVIAAPGTMAIYHRDAVNMVTHRNSTDTRHCLCETITTMLPDAPEPVRPLLRRLFNLEVYLYALYAAKERKVDRAFWRGFYAQEDPLRFLVLAGLSTRTGAYAARRLRSILRRRPS